MNNIFTKVDMNNEVSLNKIDLDENIYLNNYFTHEEIKNICNELDYLKNHMDEYKGYDDIDEFKKSILYND